MVNEEVRTETGTASRRDSDRYPENGPAASRDRAWQYFGAIYLQLQ